MVIGNYCKTFADATHGMPQGVSLNAPYRFHWVKVKRVEGKTLHCTEGGTPIELRIRKGRGGREYVNLTIEDPIFGPLDGIRGTCGRRPAPVAKWCGGLGRMG